MSLGHMAYLVTVVPDQWYRVYQQDLLQHCSRLWALSIANQHHFIPQSNGQTERMNRVLEDMLRHFVNPRQDDWDTLLPVLEFAINNSFQESIQGTPFFLIMVDVLGFLLMSGCLNQTLVLTSTWTILTRPCKRQGSALMLLCSGRRSMLISIGLSSLLRSVMRFCSVLSTFLCAL